MKNSNFHLYFFYVANFCAKLKKIYLYIIKCLSLKGPGKLANNLGKDFYILPAIHWNC